MIFGLALAGGRSSRFGSEKAVVEVGGRTMLARALDALRPGCEALAVSAKPGSGAAEIAAAEGLPALADHPNYPEGPLAGIHAGLVWAQGLGALRLLVAPCDTPYLPANYAARLLAPGGAAVAIVAGQSEPLCSAWPVANLEEIAAALQAGRHPSVGWLLQSLGATGVAFEDAAAFRNLNRVEDLG